jgi:hypothetical protein
MGDKVKVVDLQSTRIRNTGPTQPRLDRAKVAAALGAEAFNVAAGHDPGLISLAALGSALLERLRRSCDGEGVIWAPRGVGSAWRILNGPA